MTSKRPFFLTCNTHLFLHIRVYFIFFIFHLRLKHRTFFLFRLIYVYLDEGLRELFGPFFRKNAKNGPFFKLFLTPLETKKWFYAFLQFRNLKKSPFLTKNTIFFPLFQLFLAKNWKIETPQKHLQNLGSYRPKMTIFKKYKKNTVRRGYVGLWFMSSFSRLGTFFVKKPCFWPFFENTDVL